MNEDVQSALFDFQRYLMDQIPPLTAMDAVETMMVQPPQLLMKQVQAWAVEQSRFQQASMSDFIFHALKKIHMFVTLKLLERAAVEKYLATVIPLAMQVCPADERELLRTNLVSLQSSIDILGATPVVDVSRPKPAPRPEPQRGALTDVMAKSAHRLGLVIERLARYVRPPAPAPAEPGAPEPPPPMVQPAADLLSMAAASSSSEEQLKQYIESLKPYTGDTDPEKLLRLLAGSVPSWDIVLPPDAKMLPSAPIEAMHKIISLTHDPSESTKRFRELVTTAIEQFNKGSLSASLSMFDLAKAVIVEKKLDPSSVDRIRTEVADSISTEQIKKYGESKSGRALLPEALSFFPTLTPKSLFDQLRGEQRPEQRRYLLGLLEAYGAEARGGALDELEKELKRPANEVDTYYLRNVIYLLHRIQRESDEGVDRELELLTKSSARGQSIYVIKEAVIPLGHIKSDASVKLLTLRLAEFEAMLLKKDTTYPVEEMQKLLDRIIAALARIATPAALLTIARHGMKANPILGDTRARLAALSQHDLSFDDQTVEVIMKAIRDDLPKKILGKVLPKLQPPPLRLIEALSGTRNEKVEALFNEIAEKFPDNDVGKVATAALQDLAAAGKRGAASRDASAASLTGDLQFFGLPALLQSLADNTATGIVTLTARNGQTAGKILFVTGKFGDAQVSSLRGADALYQMLERPVIGTFAFVPQPPSLVKLKGEPQQVMSLLLEGIRRHDELRQASVVAPDDLSLKPTAVRPTPDPEESDPNIIREVWLKASTGARIAQWEPQIAADPYRVRRLVARWLEEGALQPA